MYVSTLHKLSKKTATFKFFKTMLQMFVLLIFFRGRERNLFMFYFMYYFIVHYLNLFVNGQIDRGREHMIGIFYSN